MSEDFQSQLRQTYSEQPSEFNNISTSDSEQPNNQITNHLNNSSDTSNYSKQAYAGVIEQPSSIVNQGDFSAWTSERVYFTITNCSFAAFLSCIAAALMVYGSPNIRESEIALVFLGQAIAGLEIGFATSLILWEKMRSGNSIASPLGASNFFTILATVPMGLIIAGCLYATFTSENVTINELMTMPLRVLETFFWVPFALIPFCLVAWGMQAFLTKNYFSLTATVTNSDNISQTLPNRAFEPALNKFSVKRANSAARCDICHQDDMFVAKTSFCRRCQRYTV